MAKSLGLRHLQHSLSGDPKWELLHLPIKDRVLDKVNGLMKLDVNQDMKSNVVVKIISQYLDNDSMRRTGYPLRLWPHLNNVKNGIPMHIPSVSNSTDKNAIARPASKAMSHVMTPSELIHMYPIIGIISHVNIRKRLYRCGFRSIILGVRRRAVPWRRHHTKDLIFKPSFCAIGRRWNRSWCNNIRTYWAGSSYVERPEKKFAQISTLALPHLPLKVITKAKMSTMDDIDSIDIPVIWKKTWKLR